MHSLPQVVTTQTALLRLEPPDHIRLALLDFVSSLGRLSISKDTQVPLSPVGLMTPGLGRSGVVVGALYRRLTGICWPAMLLTGELFQRYKKAY